ncbi:response regulator transcription factor [Staphylococcus pettenkoferi]|uniref:Response regulator transcription factor n=1 Tax=Staphylococcus pettenkoferi TaxID=170573 RepID=A0A9Q4D6H7_9STAP|nr:response regulator transcription factor [Staphylococcus pettenkoferi]MCY1568538.1 response regulator transcription factor [Staphylococcus pettenkoferi]MCY1575580.1 response regulator transcription factor [Staphylococcus pettenkoferi]MCY1593714.1 response regulator transcription factor [Staphylococcus pettenkoferi]MCY1618012.1 response regulator transcription factor [Staphylococcus pettenkoferi]
MIRITIAEDQTMLRQAMVQLIEMHDDISVVGEADNGVQALQQIEAQSPDIAILDVEMPQLSGLDVLSRVRAQGGLTKIIIVTTFKRPGYFERAVANDVDAYVLKERSIDELVETMYKVMKGEKEYSTSLMTSVFKKRNPLTAKEQLVLKEIGKGYSSKDIANALYLSNGTVRNYTSALIEKLEVDNRFEAWKKAVEKGWI